ncbi:phosphate ABC transporter substrate-binding protein PstS [Neisseria sp. Ec49-e6-T10]|uniref:phosphate ABC transporter substrate-binding protein PstS n=1 Tax=Neisseria sp. Ec49-e6-T10 TaxID=3140744 RepID=UPI003EB9542E
MLLTQTAIKALSIMACATVLLAGCDQAKQQSDVSETANKEATHGANLTGAGATFPAPIYTKWADSYFKDTANRINYQGIGSSGGVKQIVANTVDFGASDAPLDDKRLKEEKLFQFPTVIGGIVLAVNIEGIKSNQLVLDGSIIADIYLGKIKKWNDEAIKKLNPDLNLPDQNIAVVRRADGSGTSFVFTNYLAKTSEIWKNQVGSGSTVNWPVGVGGKGNDGVTAFVQRLSGSIGYVEYAYAKQNNLAYTKLRSADGEILSPSVDAFNASAIEADWENSFAQDLTYRKGKNAWPISSTTFILIHTVQKDAAKAKQTLDFFNWTFSEHGSAMAKELDYAPLPNTVIEKIHTAWKTQIKDTQGQPVYP